MHIRKAKAEDSKVIASYLMLAMGDIIYNFIGENSKEKATYFLDCMIRQKANQYSYENCWVVESGEGIIAVATVYDGAKLQELRRPVAELIKSMFNRDFNPEDETDAGELYIDCVGVDPKQQGKGIGSQLFEFLIKEYVTKDNKTLGLLVEKENHKAKNLYLKLGFEVVGEKVLTGEILDHLQLRKQIIHK